MITEASRDPSSGPVRPGVSKLLKRGKACLVCRALKIKCDGVHPRCGPCMRSPKVDPCQWNSHQGKSKVAMPTEKLTTFQARITKLEDPGLTTPSVALYDPCRRSGWDIRLLDSDCELTEILFAPEIRKPILDLQGTKMPEPGTTREAIDIEKVLRSLSDILSDRVKRKALQAVKGGTAQFVIDHLFLVLSLPELPKATPTWLHKHTLVTLRKLCVNSMLYPQCYHLTGIRCLSHEDAGGFCEIHRARCSSGVVLCLKVLRLPCKSNADEVLKVCAQEAVLWAHLHHPNVVPFYGVYHLDGPRKQICLVSPWMENGNIVEYLEKNPSVARKPFIHDIADGLKYLHDNDIVHGDLKGVNVLVDDSGRACIGDFGVSRIWSNNTLGVTTAIGFTGVTTRWASPELLREGATPTRASDIWAFGCVCYEILTRLVPFRECSTDAQVIYKQFQCKLPAHPEEDVHLGPFDRVDQDMWRLIISCWQYKIECRPSLVEILRDLTAQMTPSMARITAEPVAQSSTNEGLRFSDRMRRHSAPHVHWDRMLNILEGL